MLISKSEMIGIFLIILGYFKNKKRKKEKNGTGLIEFLSGLDPRVVLKCFSFPSLGKWRLDTRLIEKPTQPLPKFPEFRHIASAGLHDEDLGFVF